MLFKELLQVVANILPQPKVLKEALDIRWIMSRYIGFQATIGSTLHRC